MITLFLVLRGLRWALRWVVQGLLWTLTLALAALISLWLGVPQGVRRISDYWTRQATLQGFPAEYYTPLRVVLGAGAVLAILLGWIALAFLTTGLVQWVVTALR